jgi:hypothetical protein
MKRRVLATILWFYAWWYAGATIAVLLDLSPALGPIMGVAAAAIFVGDPRRIIWAPKTPAATSGEGREPA